MTRWYSQIVAAPDDLGLVAAACAWFAEQHAAARQVLDGERTGERITRLAGMLPGMVEFRYAQMQEIKAIAEHLELREKHRVTTVRRRYLEQHDRQLSEALAKSYAEIDPEVLAIKEALIGVRLTVSLFEGLSRGFEYLHFQIGNIVRLRVAGIEDATL